MVNLTIGGHGDMTCTMTRECSECIPGQYNHHAKVSYQG